MRWLPGTAGRGGTIFTWQSQVLIAKSYWICSLNYSVPLPAGPGKPTGTPAKKAHTEMAEFEDEMLKWEGILDTSQETILYPASLPIPTEFGIEEFCPTMGYSEEKSKASGKMISKTFYHCTICTKRSQNKDSMYNHTSCHLNILTGCTWPNCGKKYEAPEGLKQYVSKKHGNLLAPEALCKEEAEAVVAGLSSSK